MNHNGRVQGAKGKNTAETEDGVFRFIVEYKKTHDGNSPSMRAIQAHMEFSSVSIALYHVRSLVSSGRVMLVGESKRRKIAVVGGRWTHGDEE